MGTKKLSDDIDSVLEVIHGIIIDMENDLSRKIQPKSEKKKPTGSSERHTGERHTESTISMSAPSIRELYTGDIQDASITSTINTRHKIITENRMDPADENIKGFDKTMSIKDGKRRLYVSADNTPILSRKMKPQTENFEHKSNFHTKLLIPNMEKFDIEISCPDGKIFKAAVFKVWTASQLCWKISHVKGMGEKIALILEEYITQLHLVRSIEDHECIYDVIQNWAPGSHNTIKMAEDYTKFDIFNEPTDYLPAELLDVTYAKMLLNGVHTTKRNLFSFIVKADTSVDVSHWVFAKDFDKRTWKRLYLRIKDSTLYLCENEEKDPAEWKTLYNCKDSYLYHCLDGFKTAHKPPHGRCFCIIPSVVNKWNQIKCFSIESDKIYVGWKTAFRLAKYGQQLFKNYCEAMTKEENLCRTNSSHQSMLIGGVTNHRLSESGLPSDNKAAVDFSGDNARVISDPIERLQIQNQLGFEIPRPVKRRSETFSPIAFRRAVLSSKTWYHGEVQREQAVSKLKKHGMKDGMFLVRESSSCQGNLVLTVVRKGKIAHHQIFQESTPEGKALYGMQHGPQFPSLEHFIEAYNSGVMESVDFVLKKPCPFT